MNTIDIKTNEQFYIVKQEGKEPIYISKSADLESIKNLFEAVVEEWLH